MGLREKGFDISTLKASVWNNICNAKQDYWPDFLTSYLSCIYDCQIDLFNDTIVLLYSQDRHVNELAYSVFFGYSNFPKIPQEYKKELLSFISRKKLSRQARKTLAKIKNDFGYTMASRLRAKANDFFSKL